MIILHGLSEEEFYSKMEAIIEKKLEEKLAQKKTPPYRYMNRKEVSQLLHVSLPTLHDWSKEGILPSYKIGNRVLYKSNEIEEAIGNSRLYKFKKRSSWQ